MKFRLAEGGEWKSFARQLYEQLGIPEERLPNSWVWVIAEGPRTEAYLVPGVVLKSMEELWKFRMPYSLGLFAGGVQRRGLKVSLELASYFEHLLPEGKIVLLKDEAEQPILYGHDVLASSIQKAERIVRRGELVVLVNSLREILALGEMLVDARALKQAASTQRVIHNLIDKGWYLRKGG